MMRDNTYRTILGAILLISLYLDLKMAVYITVGIVLLEGVTNLRIPILINKIRKQPEAAPQAQSETRFNMEAERLFRLTVGGLMLGTYAMGTDSVLWFFPWFMGFAILGAGVSGICPALALFKWLGFR